MLNSVENERRKGLLLAIFCYTLWGIFPLFWKLLQEVSSLFVLGNRILWSAFFLTLFCIINNRKLFKETITHKTNIKYMAIAGALVSLNWGTFIYAVNNGYIIESSIGYYLNPLANIVLGMLFFKERLSTVEKISAGLACIGVAYMTYSYGSLPVISLVLAVTFSFYGVVKKKAGLPVVPALALESLLITPLVIVYFLTIYHKDASTYTQLSTLEIALLCAGGLVTAIPLLMYARAVKAISYTTIGFLQYIGPTLQLFCAIVIYKETFTSSHWICFSFIWAGLALYATQIIRKTLVSKLTSQNVSLSNK